MQLKKHYLFILFAALMLAGCSPAARFTGTASVVAPKKEAAVEKDIAEKEETSAAAENNEALEVEIGIASYYADEFNGRPTATGEIYDMNGISAAHPFHPLGTIARVTNLVNNKSIVLEINDRMPYREDRIIDLSLGAAKELDMLIAGIQKVKIEVLKWGTGKRIERVKNPY